MAKAYPRSTFVGVDYHKESIEVARKRAQEAGVADRVTFEVASAKDYKATGFDLICFFDCLHDMGDPEGAAAHCPSSGVVRMSPEKQRRRFIGICPFIVLIGIGPISS